MKTLQDALNTKNTKFNVFGTLHNYIVELLFDYYYAKVDGEKRIAAFLQDWDDEAKQYWIDKLEERKERADNEQNL